MVERDRCEHGDLSVGDVRRVPFAAHADLQHRDVDRRVGEAGERQHGERFEEGQGLLAGRDELGVDDQEVGTDVVPVLRECPVADRPAVDHDPLVDPDQVRAGEQAGAETVRPQDALDHPAGRGLAVRAGDVDDRVGAMRIPEQLRGLAGRLQPRLGLRLADPLEQLLVRGLGVGAVLGVLELERLVLVRHPSRLPPSPRRSPVKQYPEFMRSVRTRLARCRRRGSAERSSVAAEMAVARRMRLQRRASLGASPLIVSLMRSLTSSPADLARVLDGPDHVAGDALGLQLGGEAWCRARRSRRREGA